jgi:hypothetical protein
MIDGAELNERNLEENIERSVMMVTALSPIIGYDPGVGHLALRNRPRPDAQAGSSRKGRQRGAVRPGRQPARAHPRRFRRHRND